MVPIRYMSRPRPWASLGKSVFKDLIDDEAELRNRLVVRGRIETQTRESKDKRM